MNRKFIIAILAGILFTAALLRVLLRPSAGPTNGVPLHYVALEITGKFSVANIKHSVFRQENA